MTDDSFYTEEYTDEDLDGIISAATEEQLKALPNDGDYTLSKEEEETYQKLQEKVRRQDIIIKTYLALEKRPNEDEINKLKLTHGEIYFISMTEKEHFIFRSLKRQEWRNLMATIAKLDDFKKAEAIVMKGVVWPQLNNIAVGGLSAGTIDALRDMILEASNFMTPDRAVQLVRKL